MFDSPFLDVPGIVINLNLRANSSHVSITWIPPTSQGISSDGLTHCINVSSGGSIQPFCDAIAKAEFVYEISWCDNITFTVASVNLAGKGPPLEIVYSPQVQGKLKMSPKNGITTVYLL